MREERYPRGAAIVVEGEKADCLHLLARGRAEVTTAAKSGPIVLATVEPGGIFGELALLASSGERSATVTALTDIITLVLSASDFSRLLDSDPEIKHLFEASAEQMLTARFIKRATPFARLDAGRFAHLPHGLSAWPSRPARSLLDRGSPQAGAA